MKIQAEVYAVLWLLMAVIIEVAGQLKKLGSHSPPSRGATVLGGKFPPPLVFYHHFIKIGQPLLMKNVLNETQFPAFVKWTDDYLETKYGDEIVDIERGKKEDRDGKGIRLHLSKFLEIYEKSNLYMVHTVPDSMKEEIMIPHSLQCGGFQESLQDAVLWFSAGETKSVLHYDTVDNINCLLDGEKKLVLIDRTYKRMIEEHGWVEDGAYSLVDVDAVDPLEFPGVQHAAWYQINMVKGDCVFIPYKWYHHVYSPPGRNLAVNLWFSHLWWFNTTDCKDITSKDGKPLSKFPIASPNEQLRSEFVSHFEGNGDMSLKTFKLDCGCKNEQDAEKLWEMVNKNKDRKLTIEELYSFDMDEVVQHVPGCFNIYETDDDGGEFEDHEDDKEQAETVTNKSKDDSNNVEIGEPAYKEGLNVGSSESRDESFEEKIESLDKIVEDGESVVISDEKDDIDSRRDKTENEDRESLELDESGQMLSRTPENKDKRKLENTKHEEQPNEDNIRHDEF